MTDVFPGVRADQPVSAAVMATTRRHWLGWMAVAAAGFSPMGAWAQRERVKVGVTAGPHAQIMEVVKQVAAQTQGLDIDIVEFSDYVQPNAALNDGALDANSYQHQPYLDQQVKDRGYALSNAALTVNFPMGVYSKRLRKLAELKEGARIGLPNDPTNGGRALLVLQHAGLITLRPGAGLKATPIDVTKNPKRLKFVELDAAQLPRSLADLDAAAINTNYALPAGLNPEKDALFQEAAKGPYANLLAVRTADLNKPWVAKLIKAYHSEPVRTFIAREFKGSVFPAF